MPGWIKKREIIINTMSTPLSKLHPSGPTTTNMLANKTFLFAVAAAFMALATVEAAPAIKAVQGKLHLPNLCQAFISWLFCLTKVTHFYLSIEHAACVTCDNPPPCKLHCTRGYCVSASLSSFWTPKLTFFFCKASLCFSMLLWILVILLFMFKVPRLILFCWLSLSGQNNGNHRISTHAHAAPSARPVFLHKRSTADGSLLEQRKGRFWCSSQEGGP